jgi:hypothetical protein
MSSRNWIDLSALGESAFPVEVFGYPEDSTDDTEIVYHVVLVTPGDGREVPPLPKQRMRMKILLADGQILVGNERK